MSGDEVTATLRVLHIVIDCYPGRGHEHFETTVAVVASCWLFEEPQLALRPARKLAEQRLEQVGLIAARLIEWHWFADQNEIEDEVGRQHYNQAKLDGVVIHLYQREREMVGDGDAPDLTQKYDQFVRGAAGAGLVSLYSDEDRQFANGVTPDGDEFVPFWTTVDDAVAWQSSWPGYRAEVVDLELLEELDNEVMLAGLGLAPDVLVMWHPLELAADLFAKERR